MIRLQIPDTTVPVALPDSIPTPREELSALSNLSFDELIQKLMSSMVTFAINLAIAIIVFYIGRLIINKLYRFLSNVFIKRSLDSSLTSFVLSMVKIVLYFILIVTVIGILGIETSSFIAIFASAGVAVGMALSGTLQNFAGGVLILLLKPYRIGDYIEAQGYSGTVREIQIFHTIITTGDNKAILIPNGGLSTGSVNNWSREEYRRVEWNVGISYGDSVETARAKILEILNSEEAVVKSTFAADRISRGTHERADIKETDGQAPEESPKPNTGNSFSRFFSSKKRAAAAAVAASAKDTPTPYTLQAEQADRTPVVYLGELADSSVNLKVRAWTKSTEYWNVYFSVNERIYNELPACGVSFPFPQVDVHLTKQPN